MIRVAQTDADLEAWRRVRLAVLPDERCPRVADLRRDQKSRTLLVLAEEAGETVGSGRASPTSTPGRVFVAPRVLPNARRRGVGTELLRCLVRHARTLAAETVSAQAEDLDAGIPFAERFGFNEIDRQVEQVKELADEQPVDFPSGLDVVSVAERPELLRAAYELAVESYAEFATPWPVSITLDDWLAEEATLPAGSFVALADGEIVGFAGLIRDEADPRRAEDGLTAVRRDWRRRGLAMALKRAELAWAAANGLREVYTWTQRGNEGMRAVNERLGYRYRHVVVTVQASLEAAERALRSGV
jgi:mycothiol synthase